MQVIIPMSGFGERFRRVGYQVPKPLIEIESKPIIAHVVDMFPGETDFIFICNQDHLDDPDFHMRDILEDLCPTARIVGIAPHKLGPIHAVQQVVDLVSDSEPTIVNYCDFTCYWDYSAFKKSMQETGCDGAVPAYRGFHPHTLGSTNYAYMREENMRMLDIKEKEPFTDNRMQEFASSGTYYFKSGAVMKQALADCVAQDLSINGEFYVSLAYKPMLEAGADIRVYELDHFMQWGTPEDVAEYNGWSDVFHHFTKPAPTPEAGDNHAVIIPMAGLGQRFADAGYTTIKPLIEVKHQPMVLSAVYDLPPAEHHVFVLRGDMPGLDDILQTLKTRFPQAILEILPALTDGQALTCLAGLDALERERPDFDGTVTFGACDNGAIYDTEKFAQWQAQGGELLVWGARGVTNAVRHPKMFGWIDVHDEQIVNVSVKQPLDNPQHDPIITGTVTFRSGALFRRCVESLLAREGRVNGEYYLDSCVNDALTLGLACELFENQHYISWGTPNDLKTFEYWQSCFSKWASHSFLDFEPAK